MKTGYIYFIECQPLEAVKIGFTGDHPRKRLKALQCGSPAPLRLHCFFRGSIEDERRLHAAFSWLHIHGEWFRHGGKLWDMMFCLSNGQGDGQEAQPSRFIDAVKYVLFEGRPDEPKEFQEIYNQTGDWTPFRHLLDGIDQ